MIEKTRDVAVRVSANFVMSLWRRLAGHNETRKLEGKCLDFVVRCPAQAPVDGALYAVMKELGDQYGDLEITVAAASPTVMTLHVESHDPNLVKSWIAPTYHLHPNPHIPSRTGNNILETPKGAWEYLYPDAGHNPDVVVG